MPVETPPAVHSTGSVVAAMVGLAVNGCSAKELRQAAQKRRAVIRFIVEFMIPFIVLLSSPLVLEGFPSVAAAGYDLAM
jgi:hypothetical protein